jgi:methylglutaconyl-CoA hydratase
MSETLRISIDQRGVAELRLARPQKHNAISADMIEELTTAADRLGRDDRVRLVILRADGDSFCAGGDLGWMRAQFNAGRRERMVEARRLAMMFTALNDLPKPLMARVHGNCFGGGIGLISVCDLAVAADTVRFGLTEVRLGLIPATISPFVVARIGTAAARPLFLSGRTFDAAHAGAIGLVGCVVPAVDLDTAVEAEIEAFLAASPQAASRAKALVRSLETPISDAVIDAVVRQLADSWETPEAREGIDAFFGKRKPNWSLPES